jgi:hypothetical protein
MKRPCNSLSCGASRSWPRRFGRGLRRAWTARRVSFSACMRANTPPATTKSRHRLESRLTELEARNRSFGIHILQMYQEIPIAKIRTDGGILGLMWFSLT